MIVNDMPDLAYHSRAELSSTGARKLLDSPARFRYWADHAQPSKPSFDIGTCAHSKVLGTPTIAIVYPEEHLTPSGNVSTKVATVAWEQEQRAAGLIPITQNDQRRVDAMAEAGLADPYARTILEHVTGREVTIITEVDGVPTRARFDLYDGIDAADLKTARDASPSGFNRAVGQHGYHIQEAWYTEAHKAETGQPLNSFRFIVVEATAPHLVGVYDLDLMWTDLAERRTAQARRTYLECVETGVWPGYGTATLVAPTWAVYEGEDEEIKVV